jgi:TonB family protein
VTLTLNPSAPGATTLSSDNRPVFGAATLSLVLHVVFVTLALLALASRGAGPSAISQLLSPEKLVWIGEGASGAPPGGPQRLEAPRQSAPPQAAREAARDNTPALDPDRDSVLTLIVPSLPDAAGLSNLPGTVTSLMITDGAPTGSATGLRGNGGSGTGPGGTGADGDGPGDGGSGPGGVTQPALIQQVQPGYTADALHARAQGIVTVEAVVNTDGSVGDVRVVRTFNPSYGLDAEAVRAVRQWRFRAGSRRGRTVPMYVTVELTFSLR